MKIEHLYYFLVIANEKSINKAAQKLFLSQQHLSRIIIGLENELHITLFARTPTGVELTKKGQLFAQFAEKIVNDYREMQSYFYLDTLPVPECQEELHGNSEIAFPFFFSLFLNDFITALHQLHPNITIRYFEDLGHYTPESICSSGMLHVVVEETAQIQNLLDAQSLTSYYISETGVSFCVNRNSPLSLKSILTEQDLSEQLITCYPQKNINALAKNTNILFVSSNIYQHLDSVVHNQSICIIPNYIRDSVTIMYPDIVLRPFEKQFVVSIYIVHDKNLVLTDADKSVIQFAARYLQKLTNDVLWLNK